MELRQSLSGSAVPKGLMVVLAVCAAVALAAMGTVITRDLGGSSAAVKSPVHAAPGTVLRQDNPVQHSTGPVLIDRAAEGASQTSAPATIQSGRRGGIQFEDNTQGLTADSHGPDSDLTRALPSQTGSYEPGFDARTVREGHGV